MVWLGIKHTFLPSMKTLQKQLRTTTFFMFDFNYLLNINTGIQANNTMPPVQFTKICSNMAKDISHKATHTKEPEPGIWKGVQHYEFD